MKNKLDRELFEEIVKVDENGKRIRSLGEELEHEALSYVAAWADKYIDEEAVRAQLLADATKGGSYLSLNVGEFKYLSNHDDRVLNILQDILEDVHIDEVFLHKEKISVWCSW